MRNIAYILEETLERRNKKKTIALYLEGTGSNLGMQPGYPD
jgi:hypothetical protein